MSKIAVLPGDGIGPEVYASACRVLAAAGYRVHLPAPPDGRPLCCGRSFLAVGQVDQARLEAVEVPSRVHDLVLSRLARLPQRGLLEWLAVLDRGATAQRGGLSSVNPENWKLCFAPLVFRSSRKLRTRR